MNNDYKTNLIEYFDKLLLLTTENINISQFALKILYGNIDSGIIYIEMDDILKILNKKYYIKLFLGKNFVDEIDGFYELEINQRFLNENEIKISPRGNKYMQISINFLKKVENTNELLTETQIFDIHKTKSYYNYNDISLKDITVKDFMAIIYKQPISNNEDINNLIIKYNKCTYQ